MLVLGAGGVMAPAASANSGFDDARYTQTDLNGGGAQSGFASEDVGASGTQPPVSSRSLRCWNPYLSGRAFAVSCSGVRYWVYADCSNDVRYVVGPLTGAKRVAITCPGYSRAERGGAYGS